MTIKRQEFENLDALYLSHMPYSGDVPMPDDELPNRWLGTIDPRFAGLRDIARFIESAFQTQVTVEDVVDSGFQVGTYLFPPPLELASLMEESARRIRDLTSDQA